MGALANALLTALGKVAGVIPEALVAREVAHGALSEDRVVQSGRDASRLCAELHSRWYYTYAVYNERRGEEMPEVTVLRSEGELQSRFSRRLWTLFHEIPSLYESVLRAFEREGLSATDVKPEVGDGSLGAYSIGFWLLALRGNVRIRLEHATLSCPELSTVDRSRLISCIDSLLKAVTGAGAEGLGFSGHTISYSGHLALPNGSPEEFISQFVRGLPKYDNIGPPLGNSVAFYFGRHDHVLNASVILERSALYESAVYVRSVQVLTGDLSNGEQILTLGERSVLSTLGATGLVLPEVV